MSDKKTSFLYPADGIFYMANDIRNSLFELINDNQAIEFDFAELEEVDSSTIQIILSAQQQAIRQNKIISFKNIPDELSQFIKLYKLERFIFE